MLLSAVTDILYYKIQINQRINESPMDSKTSGGFSLSFLIIIDILCTWLHAFLYL